MIRPQLVKRKIIWCSR